MRSVGLPRARGPVLIVPDQLIDYTWDRHSTFCGQSKRFVQHVDFSFPFDQALSDKLVDAVNTINNQSEAARPVMIGGVYGVTGATSGNRC